MALALRAAAAVGGAARRCCSAVQAVSRGRARPYTTLTSAASAALSPAPGGDPFVPRQALAQRVTVPLHPSETEADIYLAAPAREDLVRVTKNVSQQLRFLKLVTDQEGRPEDFHFFAKRCDAGLVVEDAVYVTKAELLALLWENGYTELEINAYEIAFPKDYRFHYPELSILFSLPEEDCYKFCLRTRAASPGTLVRVRERAPQNLIGGYGVAATAAWFGLQHAAFGNVWMFVKTLPFFSVFYMLAAAFQRRAEAALFAPARAEAERAAENRLRGEDALYRQVRAYANDAAALVALDGFRAAARAQLPAYRAAVARAAAADAARAAEAHLNEIETAEKGVQAALHGELVARAVDLVREELGGEGLQERLLDEGLRGLGRRTPPTVETPPEAGSLPSAAAQSQPAETTAAAHSPTAVMPPPVASPQEKTRCPAPAGLLKGATPFSAAGPAASPPAPARTSPSAASPPSPLAAAFSRALSTAAAAPVLTRQLSALRADFFARFTIAAAEARALRAAAAEAGFAGAANFAALPEPAKTGLVAECRALAGRVGLAWMFDVAAGASGAASYARERDRVLGQRVEAFIAALAR